MNIVFNNKELECREDLILDDLVVLYKQSIKKDKVVVAVNGKRIIEDQYKTTVLQESDKVVIRPFIGGG